MSIHAKWLGTIGLAVAVGLMADAGLAADTFNLGPTGLVGAVSKNTITVTSVANSSPADGKIAKGDQIIGAAGKRFAKDVRRELAAAINEAETEAGAGKLTLMLKGGKTVDLQLTVLGSYAATAPYDCPKSEAIITKTADKLIASGEVGKGACVPGILGLLATGEQKYIDEAAKAIKAADWSKTDGEPYKELLAGTTDMGYVTWRWGYQIIAMSEYYLMTKDESVLPAIRTYALTLAMGQDPGGLYGHRLATKRRYGRLPGYAQMNQPSLSVFVGMIMARKCGIDEPALDEGIARTYAYYKTFIGKGGFNYGVHGPNTRSFNNNGTSGSAAIAMSLLGNRDGARFFSQLCAPSSDGQERGHASTFFNPLRTPLGANLSGPEVTQQFFDESLWLHTMYRNHDFSFSRFGGGQKEGPQAGVALLTYCLPRRALYITGKESDESIWLTGEQATAAVQRSKVDYKAKSVDELIALFGHEIPHVRRAAIWTLREKEGDFIPKLVKMIDDGTDLEKQSAIGYFGYKCPPEVQLPRMEQIGKVLRNTNEDPEVRAAAADALAWMGEEAYPYYQDILKMIMAEEPGDRFGDIDQSLAGALEAMCKTPFEAGLAQKDKDLFYNTAIKLAEHKRQQARAVGMRMLVGMPVEDFHRVAYTVMYIIEDRDETYHSYHAWQGHIGAAISVLAELNIAEGIDLTTGMLDREGGKWGFKVRMVMATLPKYGGNAKEALKKIQADERLKNVRDGRFRGPWDRMVEAIENDTNPRELITLEQAKQAGR